MYRITNTPDDSWWITSGENDEASPVTYVAKIADDADALAEALALVADANRVVPRPRKGYRQGRSKTRLARSWPAEGTASRRLLDLVADVDQYCDVKFVTGRIAGIQLDIESARAGQMLGDLEKASLVERVPGSVPLAWRLSDHARTLRAGAPT